MSEEFDKVVSILEKNADKDFVKRIVYPDKYPKLTTEDGKSATHQMAWGSGDGKFYVYPSIVHDNGELTWLKDEDRWNYAKEKGEYIEFDSAEEAEWFSMKYKLVWPEEDQK